MIDNINIQGVRPLASGTIRTNADLQRASNLTEAGPLHAHNPDTTADRPNRALSPSGRGYGRAILGGVVNPRREPASLFGAGPFARGKRVRGLGEAYLIGLWPSVPRQAWACRPDPDTLTLRQIRRADFSAFHSARRFLGSRKDS
ncbi:MAG: hypothetical protein IMZ62_09940 [Chloroflexi bacterium]|nr:hypothetical protein [Chloroflexota bacterium]